MGFLTERERYILKALSNRKTVSEIAKEIKVSLASISRSISRIRLKCMELEDDINILKEIGFLKIERNELKFISRDPKALMKKN